MMSRPCLVFCLQDSPLFCEVTRIFRIVYVGQGEILELWSHLVTVKSTMSTLIQFSKSM